MGLGAGVSTLHIENWGTGQTLVDLDLRGHLQILCIDRPCLSLCQSAGPIDASAPALDSGAADAPVATDGEVAIDVSASIGAVSDAGVPAISGK